MSNHTKGPWIAAIHSGGAHVNAESNPIALIAGPTDINRITQEEMAANAQLIAAAPKLLKALEDLMADFFCEEDEWPAKQFWEDGPKAINELKALIKEAGGSVDD